MARTPRRTGSPIPFILGAQRSGTTLVRAMLIAHPCVAVPGEMTFLTDLFAATPQEIGLTTGEWLARFSTHERWQTWGPDVSRPPAHVLAAENRHDLVVGLYRWYADSRGKPRFGDKTNAFGNYVSYLATLIPESVFIHVLRNGREVTASVLRAPWGPTDIATAATEWVVAVRRINHSLSHLSPARHLTVRYEHLVAAPEQELRRICSVAELEYSPLMLRYWTEANEILRTTKWPSEHSGIRVPLHAARRSSLGNSDRAQIATFQRIAGSLNRSLGY